MSLAACYAEGKFGLSFELFPPKTPESESELYVQLAELMAFEPSYVTCTYGAGGSTRSKTLDVVERVRREFGCAVASHLTCVGSTVEELAGYLAEAEQRGVEYIVALRGDPPRGQTSFQPVVGGLRYANELVRLIRERFPRLGVAVAGYPEKHLEAPSLEVDLENLRRKVEAGADIVITQLFYDNADFFHFRQRCEQLGIRVPIVPGILPVTNLAQIKRLAGMCGAKIPSALATALEQHVDDPAAQATVGIDYAVSQVQQLIDQGVPGLHFYVLNKSAATSQVLRSVQRPS